MKCNTYFILSISVSCHPRFSLLQNTLEIDLLHYVYLTSYFADYLLHQSQTSSFLNLLILSEVRKALILTIKKMLNIGSDNHLSRSVHCIQITCTFLNYLLYCGLLVLCCQKMTIRYYKIHWDYSISTTMADYNQFKTILSLTLLSRPYPYGGGYSLSDIALEARCLAQLA